MFLIQSCDSLEFGNISKAGMEQSTVSSDDTINREHTEDISDTNSAHQNTECITEKMISPTTFLLMFLHNNYPICGFLTSFVCLCCVLLHMERG